VIAPLGAYFSAHMPTPMMDRDQDAVQVFDRVSIRIAFKMGYITNNYREPSFRAIEVKYGLPRQETLVLIFLGVLDGSTASEICEHSGHLKTNISRAVTALETKGLIRRLPSVDDQRRQHLYLTEKGRELHSQFMPMLDAREQAMMSCLTKAEYGMFEELLSKICAHVPKWNSDAL
jgi:DNA-binding MarR family transcriptional regulator